MERRADLDGQFMDRALELAARAYGETAPNPLVGAVVARGDRLLAQAYHHRAGLPHAEPQALDAALANNDAIVNSTRDWTLYVNLEPCTHHGRTPPCVEAILRAPVARVVVPIADPDARVAGGGIAALRAAGVEVDVGCRAEAAAELNHVFIARQKRSRPFVALKVALSADGCVARQDGTPTQITGREAQQHAHRLRAGLDGILVGVETLRLDRPRLDRRFYDGPGRAPRRLVIDPDLRAEPEWLWPGETPPVLFCSRAALERRGGQFSRVATLCPLPAGPHGLDLHALLDALPAFEVWSVLVEGGGRTHRQFLAAGLWDRFYMYRNPHAELHGLKWIAADAWAAERGSRPARQSALLGTDELTIHVHPALLATPA